MTAALMIQGTGSDVGKSLIVAGLARAFTNRGLRVRPFKPQNMSNNAAVTADGGEIGRAQALQARAARIAPSVHMNPVLLKPQSEVGSQVVVQGKVLGNYPAREFQGLKPTLMQAVRESFASLSREADLVLVEGAGSASEINLRRNDIANMGFARAADVPVILVGDIDRGGVFAQLVGTKAVIDPADAAMIAGFIVNRFRGDPALFADGMATIAARTGWPAIGLVPHFTDAARLPAEDALALDHARSSSGGARKIVVPLLPHIANFDDFDPLDGESDLAIVRVKRGTPLPVCDCIILPGSKATLADLAAFRAQGWDIDLAAHVRRGGHVLGICGGYQMLGTRVTDPHGVEGPPGEAAGLGLLDVATRLTGEKTLASVAGATIASGTAFSGYEMHVGVTAGADAARPVLRFADGRTDGAMSRDGRIRGVYVHGLFANDGLRQDFVATLGATPTPFDYEAGIDDVLDRLAAHLETHLDCDRLLAIARRERPTLAHGGALRAAERMFPDAPKPWLDLSTGINPVAYPVGDLAQKTWARLPERDEIHALEAIAAKTYGVRDQSCVVAAPGVQSLIQLLPMVLPAKTVAVLGPTYDEHALRWRRAGATVRDTEPLRNLPNEERRKNADVVVLVNPNNPDGRIVAHDDLARLASCAKLLVVDESFADVAPRAASFAPQAPDYRAIVLRSFGKFFGLAGLRLGFAIAPHDIAERLRDALGPWAVSGPAVAIGARALADDAWQAASRARLATDAARLDAILTHNGLSVRGGTSLFRLVAHPDASGLHRALCARGILTRVFAAQPTWMRFGLPGEADDEWRRLAQALSEHPAAT